MTKPRTFNTIVRSDDPLSSLRKEYEHRGAPVSELVTITPQIATSWLEGNTDNRTLSSKIVSAIALDIREGRWKVNGETIIISETNDVNDGQHRLWAIIEANVPVQSMVVYGVQRHTRDTVDIGRARSVSDFLHMGGVEGAKLRSAVSSHLWNWENGTLAAKGKEGTKTQILEYYENHKTELNELIAAIGMGSFKQIKMFGGWASIVFALVVFSRKAGRDTALDFWRQLYSGANLRAGSSLLYLRNRFSADTRLPLTQRFELYVRTWNAWREARDVKTLPILGDVPDIK